jgi:hypothetical protein
MQPEETLDLLLTERIQRGSAAALPRKYRQVSVELALLLATIARLDGLRDVRPSADFADDLERRLMARMAELPQPAQAASVGADAVPRPLRAARVARAPRISARLAWISVAAALALTIGLGAFAAQAAPGGPLYPVREFAQHVAAQAFPSPTATAQAALARASVDLAAYQSAIAHGDTPAALAALSALRSDDAQAAQDIAALQDASARKAMQGRLAQFRQSAAADLRVSLTTLDWQARAQVTDALRAWGDTTLRVTQARLLAASSSGQDQHTNDGSGDALLTVSGAGFTPGALVLVNGQPVGEIIALTPEQIKAHVAASAATGGALIVGVETSDGEVAITTNVQQDGHGSASHAPTPGNAGSTHGSGEGSAPSPTETRSVGLGG